MSKLVPEKTATGYKIERGHQPKSNKEHKTATLLESCEEWRGAMVRMALAMFGRSLQKMIQMH